MVLISIPALSFFLIQSSRVQTYLTQTISRNLSDYLHTRISVGRVDIAFFRSVVLEEVYVEDNRSDTMIYIDRMKASVRSFDYSEKKLDIGNLTFEKSVFQLYSDSAGKLNFEFLIDALSGNNSSGTGWSLKCRNLNIRKSSFYFKDFFKLPVKYGIDFSNLDIRKLNLSLKNIEIADSAITFAVSSLSFQEKSGFVLKQLSSENIMTNHSTELKNLIIKTNRSSLFLDNMSLYYKNSKDFKYYTRRIKMKASFRPSTIFLSDLGFFDEAFKEINETITLSGRFNGKVNDFKTKDIKILFGNESFVEGNFDLSGLPQLKETYIYADIKNLFASGRDVEAFSIPSFDKTKQKFLDQYIDDFKTLRYNGKFTGFINDFVTYGHYSTGLGELFSDISLKKLSDNRIDFNGKLITSDFDIGRFVGQDKYIGRLNLNANVKGYTSGEQTIYARMSGTVKSIEVNHYNYQNLNIEGELTDRKFDGALNINDPNIKMEFLGRFDFTNKIPVFDFTADVSNARLHALNIEKKDTSSAVSFLLTANFKGDSLDNMDGKVELFHLNYQKDNKQMTVDRLVLQAEKNKYDSLRTLTLLSDIADAEIKGYFKFTSLFNSLIHLVYNYLPAFKTSEYNESKDIGSHFSFNIHLKNTEEITAIFSPFLSINKNTLIYGEYNSDMRNMKLLGSTTGLRIFDHLFHEVSLDANTLNNELIFNANCNRILMNGTTKFENVTLSSLVKNDIIDIGINWKNNSEKNYSGDLKTTAHFLRMDKKTQPVINLELHPCWFSIADTVWNVDKSNIVIDSTMITVFGFKINHNTQFFKADGVVSANPYDTLSILFNNIDLAYISEFTENAGIKIEGILGGKARFTDIYHNMLFYSDIFVQSLKINGEKLGETTLKSFWNNEEKKLNLSVISKRGNIETITMNGEYIPETKQIDFDIALDKLRLSILQPYFEGIFSDMNGMANGNISLTGTTDMPVLLGKISLQKTAFTFEYLNSRYNFTKYIEFDRNKIIFQDITLFDETGKTAVLNGIVRHDYFTNYVLDLKLDAKNFLFMNTTEKENNLYYGRAVLTGLVNISGPDNNISITVSAVTEPGTKLYIPMDAQEDIAQDNFYTFISDIYETETDKKGDDGYNMNFMGLQMTFSLDVTPQAEVQIILDEKVGDIIKSKGSGNIRLEINASGDFSMFGEYNIEEGDYLFTLQNVINKHFEIERGGVISWSGDPYNAMIDIDAIYKLKTSLYNLTMDSTYKSRTPVECRLNMTGALMNPAIRFEIVLPMADDHVKSILAGMSDDERTKQVLSLLVMNAFFTPENQKGGVNEKTQSSGSNYGVSANTSELLSNQLSHWLSQINNDFDIGVNYRPGDEITSDEVEVALSTQILNDRISLNGNVGVGDYKTTTSNIVGDFIVDVKINKSGKLRVKGYNKANEDMIYETAPYIQGIGIFYREDFNTFGELFRRYWGKIKPKKEKK